MEGVILSSWDYIMGPQIERLWLKNNQSLPKLREVPINILRDFNICKNAKSTSATCEFANQYDLKTYSTMCGQLLLGEIDTCKGFEENTSVFYTSGSKILVSIIFHMKSWTGVGTEKEIKNVSLCLAALFKLETLKSALENHVVIDAYLRKAVDVVQKSKVPVESVMDELFLIVEDLTSLLDFLHHSSLKNTQVHFNMKFKEYLASDILPLAVVSHLQTSGHTAILGNSEFKINQILHVLSLFSLEMELCNSLPVTQSPMRFCTQGLYIQGIMKDSEKDSEFLLDKAFRESLPLTIVDTDKNKVWQTWPSRDRVDKNKNSCAVAETGCLIPQLFTDLSLMESSQGECKIFIQKFLKFLTMKSVSLIKAVYHFREKGKCLPEKALMTMFALRTFDDLQILLGCAEKLKPGIRSCLV